MNEREERETEKKKKGGGGGKGKLDKLERETCLKNVLKGKKMSIYNNYFSKQLPSSSDCNHES